MKTSEQPVYRITQNALSHAYRIEKVKEDGSYSPVQWIGNPYNLEGVRKALAQLITIDEIAAASWVVIE